MVTGTNELLSITRDRLNSVMDQAAQWGADEELKAVCQLLYADLSVPLTLSDIRAARRPKPPTLKEQALAKTTAILNDPNRALLVEVRETLELNLLALEALND
jgi:hypothetical protein